MGGRAPRFDVTTISASESQGNGGEGPSNMRGFVRQNLCLRDVPTAHALNPGILFVGAQAGLPALNFDIRTKNTAEGGNA
ncbi:hypothetical protein NJB18091_11210 [Mycobacterium marinum]|nr:hypothetical protein NJB18091_11210 [Mycobacterium marinum]